MDETVISQDPPSMTAFVCAILDALDGRLKLTIVEIHFLVKNQTCRLHGNFRCRRLKSKQPEAKPFKYVSFPRVGCFY